MEHLQQFEALFNYATIGIILCNSQAEIVNANTQAQTQFGYTHDELVGNKIEMLIPTHFRERHVAYRDGYYGNPHNRVMGAGRDLFGQKKDGTGFPVEVSLSNYTFQHQTYVIAFIIDITIRKNNEQVVLQQKAELEGVTRQVTRLNGELEQKVENRTKMLRETLAELERSKKEVSEALEKEKELGELKTSFVTMASHEFRTPLSTILSSAYLLSRYNAPDDALKREKHIRRITDAVNGMKSILEDFLSLGKLEEGLVSARMQWVSNEAFVGELHNIVSDMQQIAREGQQVKVVHQGNGDVLMDLSLLRNILANLVSNAIKFSPEGSAVTISSTLETGMLTISVQDEGIGISAEDREHLFEKFFRAHNAANIQGTGLGLHIVAKYLELVNGTIDLHSELNKGTCFIINIPQHHAKDTAH